ncbi:MAG: helix-turn-helix transcriptional regulator [Ruminococcus sp.]|nr:helix-turn-helix transcriptional regulator [Ruminococcus sp.]
MSKIVFQNSHIVVIPSFRKTATHKHPFLHLFFGKNGCKITANGREIQGNIILLDSSVKHIVKDGNGCDFFLLIDPTSVIAEQLHNKYLKECFYADISVDNADIPLNLLNLSSHEIIKIAENVLSALDIKTNKMSVNDERIEQIIVNIISGAWLNYSVKKISEEVFLSESRLTHLFKEEAGISLKSYILIRKMERAYKFVTSGGKITQAAQEAGFSSSAHLAYTCKSLTGISITDVLKKS